MEKFVAKIDNWSVCDSFCAGLKITNNINNQGYYAKMAIAWAVSICYIKLPITTTIFLNSNNLDDYTFNKALQKITESNRVNKETKVAIRSMKRG